MHIMYVYLLLNKTYAIPVTNTGKMNAGSLIRG